MYKKQLPKFVVLGPQGAGKGTQAGFLTRHFSIPHISTGDVLRAEIASGSVLGKKIAAIINDGNLVPSAWSNKIMSKRLRQKDCRNGWLADGYPRRIDQATALQRTSKPVVVLHLHISDAAAIKRLSGRRVCPHGHIYHMKFHKPKKRAGYCDHDGLKLKQRDDDTPVAIRRRLKIFHAETEPVLAWYKKKKLVVTVDAHGSIHDVYQSVLEKLQQHSPWLFSKSSKK